MRSICIFLGANPGSIEAYAQATQEMGRELATRGLTCVYGGSDTGLMKLLADSVLEAGGKVIGVTVQALKDKEIFHPGLTELHVVPTMHDRKALMAELSDGFVALPGGIGTFEEFFEVYTWAKLGFHTKPCGLLNVNNYYAPLDALLDNAEREGFLASSDRNLVIRADNAADMLDRMVKT
ncbi:putative cytokinin riboside 5'-monophosphate phosphoribohydrolase [Desulfoluna limicola]|uniref:Cytokinin riboside 5'-monophosphate phosphoribohydrolase n=1 Tax=Desulfoluna limicola TaxID=2810562 RepID=A0ABM7PHX2_9BACT|nr:TIGR00730 family Rossman fold protein [Desulfoluna limicola]BCS96693.1 putative cytokinin riboside 5'-monophosphate phosphoribohydrolase [Desulfoluna limicola]